jgi:hypothetical protein
VVTLSGMSAAGERYECPRIQGVAARPENPEISYAAATANTRQGVACDYRFGAGAGAEGRLRGDVRIRAGWVALGAPAASPGPLYGCATRKRVPMESPPPGTTAPENRRIGYTLVSPNKMAEVSIDGGEPSPGNYTYSAALNHGRAMLIWASNRAEPCP